MKRDFANLLADIGTSVTELVQPEMTVLRGHWHRISRHITVGD